MSTPTLVNNVNVAGLNKTRGALKGNPKMGSKAEVPLVGDFDPKTGIFTVVVPTPNKDAPGATLRAGPLPHCALPDTDKSVPSPLAYCPLAVAGCYSMTFFVHAADLETSLDSYKTTVTTTVNTAALYDAGSKAVQPWHEVALLLDVKTSADKELVDDMAAYAHKHCPATELLTKPVVVKTKVQPSEVTKDPVEAPKDGRLNGFDMNSYRAFGKRVAADAEVAKIEQKGTGQWFCQNECKEHPDAQFHISVTAPDGKTTMIPQSGGPPVGGSGKYVNPIQYCEFGLLSMFTQTLALRLSAHNITIKSLRAKASFWMNKRNILIENGPIFHGVDLNVDVASNATAEVLKQCEQEARDMSLGVWTVQNEVPLNTSLNITSS